MKGIPHHASAKVTAGHEGWLDWTYKGVDHSFPGNGGLECRDFLSLPQRYWESGAASIVAILALILSYPRLRLPPKSSPCGPGSKTVGAKSTVAQAATVYEPVGKRILLLLMCLTFGIELGFKFATRQMIWIGNPCHLATMMQIFILSAPPSRIVTAAFRLHMHMLTGAPIAILFPVINTRLLPFETGVYFLQHVLMLIIPFYCLWLGDPFIPEKLGDFSWAMTSFGLLFLYHFIPLQFLAYISQVNLNNMLCPAVSDPFRGKFYRLFAIGHQFVLIPTLGKVFVILARAFGILACDSPQDCEHAVSVITNEDCPTHCSPSCHVTTISKGSVCRVPMKPRCRPTSSSRYNGSSSCRDFYTRKRFSCLDEDYTCPCCRRIMCTCRSSSRRRRFSSISGNRCRSNMSGLISNTLPSDEGPQKGDPNFKRDESVDEEEDSGFLGETVSGGTTPSTSNSTNVVTRSCAAQVQAGQEEASSTQICEEQENEDSRQEGSDGESYICSSCCYNEKLSDDHCSDSGSSAESQHQDNHVQHQHNSLKQQKQEGEGVEGGWDDGQANIDDTSVQHIINGKMVERKSGQEHEDLTARSCQPTVRQRNGQGHVVSSSSSSGSSQQRKSREIVVEGGPPLRVFELKNCGNLSKVTSSVERALSGGSSAVGDDREDHVVSEFRKLRSKVH